MLTLVRVPPLCVHRLVNDVARTEQLKIRQRRSVTDGRADGEDAGGIGDGVVLLEQRARLR
jgi:hypothetical protein